MKVLVPIKRVVDPYVKIRLRADKQGIETQGVKMAMNPFDEIALEEAVRWKEAGFITQIEVISIGDKEVAETLRQALALGADEATHVLTSQPLEPLAVATCLRHFVEKQQPSIVILGKQAIDDDCNQTGQMLAGLLDWPQATFASHIVFDEEKKGLQVTREVDEGLEVLKVSLPAVITTDLRLNQPRYATLPNIVQAKRKPLLTVPLEELKLSLPAQLKVVEVLPPRTRPLGKKVSTVEELIHYLKEVERLF